jgi:septal ring factor EnvC (AmiA/AmiB activator)
MDRQFRRATITVSFPVMRKSLIAAAAVILATASCATPKFQADVATQLRAAADEMQLQRQDMSLLQEQIDSLKVALAKQDTLIKKLANLAGIPGQ